MSGTEIVAAFVGLYMAINVATDNAMTGWKELCEGWGGTYAPSEQLLQRSGNIQYWGCFGAEDAPRPNRG